MVHTGDRILGPFRLTHFSKVLYGDDAGVFNARRWLRPANEKGAGPSSDNLNGTFKGFYPFGGGQTHCPGRILAKKETCLFVARALERFDMVPLGAPTPKWQVPGISVQPPLTALDPDGEFLVKVRLRKGGEAASLSV
jgi:cytochrome P450